MQKPASLSGYWKDWKHMSESSRNSGNGVEEFHVFLSRECEKSWFGPMCAAVYLGDKPINTILCAQVLSAFRTVWLLEKEDAIANCICIFSPL